MTVNNLSGARERLLGFLSNGSIKILDRDLRTTSSSQFVKVDADNVVPGVGVVRREVPAIGVTIHGRGEVGDKARQVISKTPWVRLIGFHVMPRTILAEQFFDDYFRQNGLGGNLRDVEASKEVVRRVLTGDFTTEQVMLFQHILKSYDGMPLAVRSSASGDARGTGIYHTAFSINNIGALKRALRSVLASYYTEDAAPFRKDTNTEGFGVMIEPIIGQRFGHVLAPVLSGYGFTSEAGREGYIAVVPGMCGGVIPRKGEKITRSSLEKYGGNLRK